MAVNYNASLKNTRMNAVLAAIDAGSGPNATLELGVSGMGTILAILDFDDPSGSVTADVLTFAIPILDTTANATGTAQEARIKDTDGNIVVSGLSVGLSGSGADIILADTAIVSGQPVSITSATITHAA